MSVKVGMHAKIKSPSGKVTVGPKRELTVTIEAWGNILQRGGGGGGKGGGGIGGGGKGPVTPDPGGGRPGDSHRRQPLGDGGNSPGKGGLKILGDSNIETEAGKVEVKFGNRDFIEAVQRSSRKWKATGTVHAGSVEITAKAYPDPEMDERGKLDTDTDTIDVTVDDSRPDIEINFPGKGHEEKGKGPDFNVTVEGTASDNESGLKDVLIGIDEASEQVEVDDGEWSKDLTLRGAEEHDIVARAVDRVGNEKTRTRTVTTVDNVGPDITIETPGENDVITWEKDKTIEVIGTATDKTSGVASVHCKISGGEEKEAELEPIDDSEKWKAEFKIPDMGSNTITVRAEDKAGNPEAVEQKLEVAVPPDRIALGTTRSDYLKDLLLFAGERIIREESGSKIDEKLLAETFHQPFGPLKQQDVAKQATREISQIRIAVEVLRGFLGEQAEEIESGYPKAAYRALLRQLGTSYEEVRKVRADDKARRDLAERLGLKPEKLNRLFIPPEELGEEKLEDIFGLVNTGRRPLDPPPDGRASLLRWRQQHLRNRWEEEGRGLERPIIDPDLVGEPDLVHSNEENTALQLLKTRQEWVDRKLEQIRGVHEDISDPAKAFSAVTEEFIDSDIELENLARQREEGIDIRDQLDTYKLDLAAFLHLLQMQKLAVEEAIRESDWEEVDAILLQVLKRNVYSDWQDKEREDGIILSPDAFKLREESTSGIPLPRWRTSREARRRWEDILETRIEQKQGIERTLRKAVDEVEQSTLPILRDALIAKAVESRESIDADWLTQRLAIDVSSESEQKTTRIRQAIETLQTVLFSVRANKFGALDPAPDEGTVADWQIIDESNDEEGDSYEINHFDEEWQWIGSYSTWRSAMAVFLHPENYLLPSLREKDDKEKDEDKVANILTSKLPSLQEKAKKKMKSADKEERARFWNFINELRRESPLTRSKAHTIASKYADYSVPLSRKELSDLREKQQEEVSPELKDPVNIDNNLKEKLFFVPLQVALQLQKSGEYLAALDWFRLVYAYDLPKGKDEDRDNRKIYYGLVLEKDINFPAHRPEDWLLEGLNPHQIVNKFSRRPNAYTRFTLMSLVRCLLDYADAEFARETAESLPKARGLYLTALEQLDHPALQPPEDDDSPFPPNDLPVSLRQHAENNLLKLQQGRNIAGLERHALMARSETDARDGQAVFGSGNELIVADSVSVQPTSYRYSPLIKRTKQLVGLAQQLEASFLSAIEKGEDEEYTLLRARDDLDLAEAGVELQSLRVQEAENSKNLARLKQDRAEIRKDTYQEWIDEGLMGREKGALALMGTSLLAPDNLSVSAGFPGGMSYSASFSPSGKLKTLANILSTSASYDRRRQQWGLQKNLAEKDIQIGSREIALAGDRVSIREQERNIAKKQVNQADKAVNFLAHGQFTNTDLYEWMSGILGQVYSYFLRQAASMARLAQRQLAFQRQEMPPIYIQADYWQAPTKNSMVQNENGQKTDRRGLTGSARLLEDIYQLDQYAYETKERKLQLSQTFSLARLAPFEFQRFRETGVLLFDTPMELFDQAFPGHYMRLIKRVRTSVMALVPPTEGIRATLSASGISRVVTGDKSFQTTIVRRSPEEIAFTSPVDASGLLELEPEKQDLFLPFEGMGVDTLWQLQMPEAANSFDYSTIADVLITIDYTAFNSPDYRRKVIQELDRTASADRSFSFRNQFPDQWYNLHNPDQTDTPMRVQFDTRRQDFPPNLSELDIQQILLYFVRADSTSFEVDVDHLHLITDETTTEGEEARTVDGIISTRRANGASWMPLKGKSPTGTWELNLPDTTEVKDRFRDEKIEDILFVITYEGQTPAWPE